MDKYIQWTSMSTFRTMIGMKAFQRLPAETKASLNSTAEALKERFEPASQKTRVKKTADLAEDLLFQADNNKARETLALNAYLALACDLQTWTPLFLQPLTYLSPRATVANVTGAELEEEATTGQVGAVSESEKLEASSQPHKRFGGRRDVSDQAMCLEYATAQENL